MREAGFAELEIEEPENRLLSYLELKQNTTNLSRWIKDGFERLYHAIYLAVVQTLPDHRDSVLLKGDLNLPRIRNRMIRVGIKMAGNPELK